MSQRHAANEVVLLEHKFSVFDFFFHEVAIAQHIQSCYLSILILLPILQMAQPPVVRNRAAVDSGFAQQNVGVFSILAQASKGML